MPSINFGGGDLLSVASAAGISFDSGVDDDQDNY